MTIIKSRFIAAIAMLATIIVVALSALPAAAAEPLFPPGSRIGLVPPPGMVAAKTFPGFVDTDNKAAILITALPAGAFNEVEKTLNADALKKQGITLEKREALQLAIGKAVLVVGTQIAPDKTTYRKWLLLADAHAVTAIVSVQLPQQSKAYPDDVLRTALNSVALRAKVPDAELLTMLPFTVGDLAGFRVMNVVPGRALLLIDRPDYPHMVATPQLPELVYDARCTILAAPGGPNDKAAQPDFARTAFATIGGIKNVQITMAEPVRLDQQDGYETVAHAKDAATGADLMVVQWLRFGNGSFLQMVGIARAPLWDSELARLRSMRASIALR
jgi:predicted regulator of Ras-like GTPase activity (Roadblock/LC7/MglB family)